MSKENTSKTIRITQTTYNRLEEIADQEGLSSPEDTIRFLISVKNEVDENRS